MATYTGIHVVNGIEIFPDANVIIATSGYNAAIGGIGPYPDLFLFNQDQDVYTSSRLLVAPIDLNTTFGITSFAGTSLTNSDGNFSTALTAVCYYAGKIYVAFRFASAINEEVNAGEAIYSIDNVTNFTADSFQSTWVEEKIFSVTTFIFSMCVYNNVLYVMTTADGTMTMWQYDGATWSINHTFSTIITPVYVFVVPEFFGPFSNQAPVHDAWGMCVFNGLLYAGINNTLWQYDGATWTQDYTFTLQTSGNDGDIIESIATDGHRLYLNVLRDGNISGTPGTRTLYKSSGTITTLFTTMFSVGQQIRTGGTARLTGSGDGVQYYVASRQWPSQIAVGNSTDELYFSTIEMYSGSTFLYRWDGSTLTRKSYGVGYGGGVTAIKKFANHVMYVLAHRFLYSTPTNHTTTGVPDAQFDTATIGEAFPLAVQAYPYI